MNNSNIFILIVISPNKNKNNYKSNFVEIFIDIIKNFVIPTIDWMFHDKS